MILLWMNLDNSSRGFVPFKTVFVWSHGVVPDLTWPSAHLPNSRFLYTSWSLALGRAFLTHNGRTTQSWTRHTTASCLPVFRAF